MCSAELGQGQHRMPVVAVMPNGGVLVEVRIPAQRREWAVLPCGVVQVVGAAEMPARRPEPLAASLVHTRKGAELPEAQLAATEALAQTAQTQTHLRCWQRKAAGAADTGTTDPPASADLAEMAEFLDAGAVVRGPVQRVALPADRAVAAKSESIGGKEATCAQQSLKTA